MTSKTDLWFVVDYLFIETHYPYYVKKYCRHVSAVDLENKILHGVKMTDRTR